MYSVYGIGNPLMDYIVYADYELLASLHAKPGTMNLIDGEQRQSLHSRLEHYYTIPGGSCANTVRGIAWLGKIDPIAPACYAGAVGGDDVGSCYISELGALGIITRIAVKESETGTSTIIVTPDCERTMFTYLGACREFEKADLDFELLQQAQYLHIAGYMWDTDGQKRATLSAISAAREAGVVISFDLADPFLVQRNRKEFLGWIPEMVNLLFGNREEISLMLQKPGGKDGDLIREAGKLAPLVAMKVGAEGCYVNDRGRILYSPGFEVLAMDTTGAGDFFAAGFLFNLIKGRGIEASARLANRFGAAIVKVEGCSLFNLDQRDILSSSSERH
jgi:sugar/nucleoside kinase (ribokinase family)